MKVGVDLDNTILDYTRSVEIAASEALGLKIPGGLTKEDQKAHIIAATGKEGWTLVQGFAYGKHASFTRVFPGFIDFLDDVLLRQHSVRIFSHKSEFPIAGPMVDLRKVASELLQREGILQRIVVQGSNLNPVLFFETREEKIESINSLETDLFIDDLIEVVDSLHRSCFRLHIFCAGESKCLEGVLCIKNWHEMLDKFKELE